MNLDGSGRARKIIVRIAASAGGYIARCDDDLARLTSRWSSQGFRRRCQRR